MEAVVDYLMNLTGVDKKDFKPEDVTKFVFFITEQKNGTKERQKTVIQKNVFYYFFWCFSFISF